MSNYCHHNNVASHCMECAKENMQAEAANTQRCEDLAFENRWWRRLIGFPVWAIDRDGVHHEGRGHRISADKIQVLAVADWHAANNDGSMCRAASWIKSWEYRR